MSRLLIAMLACQEKEDEFSVLQGASNEPSSDVQGNDDQQEDTAFGEPSSEDTNTEPMTEEDCIPMDETVNADPNTLTGRADCGYYTYSQSCTGCHGADGDGTPSGIQLVGYIEGRPDSALIDSIVNGKGTMPPYDMMHPQSVADVLAYMRREFQ